MPINHQDQCSFCVRATLVSVLMVPLTTQQLLHIDIILALGLTTRTYRRKKKSSHYKKRHSVLVRLRNWKSWALTDIHTHIQSACNLPHAISIFVSAVHASCMLLASFKKFLNTCLLLHWGHTYLDQPFPLFFSLWPFPLPSQSYHLSVRVSVYPGMRRKVAPNDLNK